jgi:hypothetical protein
MGNRARCQGLGGLQKPLAQRFVEHTLCTIRTLATAGCHARLSLQIAHRGRASIDRGTKRFFIDAVTNTNDHVE